MEPAVRGRRHCSRDWVGLLWLIASGAALLATSQTAEETAEQAAGNTSVASATGGPLAPVYSLDVDAPLVSLDEQNPERETRVTITAQALTPGGARTTDQVTYHLFLHARHVGADGKPAGLEVAPSVSVRVENGSLEPERMLSPFQVDTNTSGSLGFSGDCTAPGQDGGTPCRATLTVGFEQLNQGSPGFTSEVAWSLFFESSPDDISRQLPWEVTFEEL